MSKYFSLLCFILSFPGYSSSHLTVSNTVENDQQHSPKSVIHSSPSFVMTSPYHIDDEQLLTYHKRTRTVATDQRLPDGDSLDDKRNSDFAQTVLQDRQASSDLLIHNESNGDSVDVDDSIITGTAHISQTEELLTAFKDNMPPMRSLSKSESGRANNTQTHDHQIIIEQEKADRAFQQIIRHGRQSVKISKDSDKTVEEDCVPLHNIQFRTYSQNNILQSFEESTATIPDAVAKSFRTYNMTLSAVQDCYLFLGQIKVYSQNSAPWLSIGVALDDTTVLTLASSITQSPTIPTAITFLPYNYIVDGNQRRLAIDVQQARFPEVFKANDCQAAQHNYALLKLETPIYYLQNKSLSYLPIHVPAIEQYALYSFNDEYKALTDFSLTPPKIDQYDQPFMHYEYTHQLGNEAAILFAKTAQGYYLAGLHLSDQMTTAKKAVCLNSIPQRQIELMKWAEIVDIRRSADEHNPVAQYELGVIYAKGHWLPQDVPQVIKWHHEAAQQGHAAAQCSLGFMYANGYGVDQDDNCAYLWYKRAAKQNNAIAQCNLGLIYTEDQDAYQHDVQAVYWYRRAAEQDNAIAQCNLGSMYSNGHGVDQSDVQAVYLYRQSAEQGYANAQFKLGVMHEKGRGVNQDSAQAFFWFSNAARQEHAAAQCNLGWMYDNGRNFDENNVKAVEWYSKAATQGYFVAQYNLGLLYDNDRGNNENNIKAVNWYCKAAEQGHAAAQSNLGWMYLKGHGVSQNDSQAFFWIQKAAQQGDAEAQCILGWMYNEGHGVQKDDNVAFNWHHKAAVQGHVDAQYNLGIMYDKGSGICQDSNQAIYWYRRATAQGHVDAQHNINK